MKKPLVTLAVLSAITINSATATPVYATDNAQTTINTDKLTISGELEFGYDTELNDPYGYHNKDRIKGSLKMNANYSLSKDADIYMRVATENWNKTAGWFQGFNYSHGKNVISVDRFGVKFHDGERYSVTIGRQDAMLGGTGLMFASNAYFGDRMWTLDGLTATGKFNKKADWQIVGARMQNYYHTGNDQLYAAHAGFHPIEPLTIGATYAYYKSGDQSISDNSTHGAIDFSYTTGPVSFYGEFARSDADDQNQAFDIGVRYTMNPKQYIDISYFRVEKQSDVNGATNYFNGEKGMGYIYNFDFQKNASLMLSYYDKKIIDSQQKHNEFRMSLYYRF